MAYVKATIDDINEILNVTQVGGRAVITGIKIPNISISNQLYVQGDTYLNGQLRANVNVTSLSVDSGSAASPSISSNSEPTTGLYFIDGVSGGLAVSKSGTNILTVGSSGLRTQAVITNSIVTSSGDLSINPVGTNIDFNGKTLLNVGDIPGFGGDTHNYDVYGGPVTTTDDTNTTILTIATSTGQYYSMTVNAQVADNVTGSNGTLIMQIRVKNVGGTLTVTAHDEYRRYLDASLSGVNISVSSVGSNIHVYASGLAATSLKWVCYSRVNKLTF